MKERLVLLVIVSVLMVLLYFFQNYMNTPCAFITILVFMALYTAYMQIAYKHRVRKQVKHPVEKNYNYQPFVSILVPAHNEENVIAETVESLFKIDYPHYELIIIDDRSDEYSFQRPTFDSP